MPYTINFTGLVCFVRQADGYLAALPNGTNATSRAGEKIEPHFPYLIARTGDILVSSKWPGIFFRNDMAFFDITGCVLDFTIANTPGTIDAQEFTDKIYTWTKLDPNFTITDPAKPKNTIASMPLRQGTFHTYRIPNNEALIGQVDLVSAGADIKVTSDDGRSITFKNDSEIVIANTSQTYAELGSGGDDSEDFYIYYVMDESGGQPGANLPTPKLEVLQSTSRHPFISGGRGLNVSCSPTLYA